VIVRQAAQGAALLRRSHKSRYGLHSSAPSRQH
jgi:hypothetical protein